MTAATQKQRARQWKMNNDVLTEPDGQPVTMARAQMLLIVIAFVGAFVIAPFARADGEIPAPFGLEWGMTVEDARALGVGNLNDPYRTDIGGGYQTIYNNHPDNKITGMPLPLPGAEYSLTFHDTLGLVEAEAYFYKDNDAYAHYAKLLTNKYGKPEVGDIFSPPRLFWKFDGGGEIMLITWTAGSTMSDYDQTKILYQRFSFDILWREGLRLKEKSL